MKWTKNDNGDWTFGTWMITALNQPGLFRLKGEVLAKPLYFKSHIIAQKIAMYIEKGRRKCLV